MKIKLTTVALIALTIMGCNSSKQVGSTATDDNSKLMENTKNQSVEDVKWVISTLEGKDMSDIKNHGKAIYFTLNSKDNRVNGYSSCNTFMGTYKLEGTQISFSQMASTRMACPDSEINESEILSVFETADNFTIADGKLSLNKARRAPLAVFVKEVTNEPIVEKYWKLKTLEGKEVKMSENQTREIYFTLKAEDNRVVGFAGCNNITGSYTLQEGNRIRFDKMATTLMMCPDVDVNESDFLKIFELADNYAINGDVLSLNVGRRAPLAVFEAVYFN